MRIKQRSLGAVKIYVEVHVLKYIHFTYIRGCEVLTQTLVVLIFKHNFGDQFLRHQI